MLFRILIPVAALVALVVFFASFASSRFDFFGCGCWPRCVSPPPRLIFREISIVKDGDAGPIQCWQDVSQEALAHLNHELSSCFANHRQLCRRRQAIG